MGRLALVLVALALAAPAAARTRPTADERHWISRIDAFANDLHANLILAASGGSDIVSARRALRNDSDIYVTLVAYTYFGGCSVTLRNVGVAPPSLAPAQRSLEQACRLFERASATFSRAVRRSDPRAHVFASQQSLAAFASVATTRARLDALLR